MVTATFARRLLPLRPLAIAAGLMTGMWSPAVGQHISPPPDLSAIIDRAAGVVEARGPDGDWIADTDADAIHRALLDEELNEGQWQRLLDRSCIIKLPPRWRSDTKLVVRARCPLWAGPRASIRIKCPDVDPRWGTWTFSQRGRAAEDAGRYAEMADGSAILCDALPIGEHTFVFDVEVIVRFAAPPGHCPREVQRTGRVTRTVQIVEKDALAPITTHDLDRAVRDSLHVQVRGRAGDRASIVATSQPTPELIALGDGVGLRAVIEVIDEKGAAVEALSVHLNRHGASGAVAHIQSYETFEIPHPDQAAQWTVRVRGDEAAVLTNGRFARYWAGEYDVPFVSVVHEPRLEDPLKAAD